jgi:hypothetical protein
MKAEGKDQAADSSESPVAHRSDAQGVSITFGSSGWVFLPLGVARQKHGTPRWRKSDS